MTSSFKVDRIAIALTNIEELQVIQDSIKNKLNTVLIFSRNNITPTKYLTENSIEEVNAFLRNTQDWGILHLGDVYDFTENLMFDENPNDNIVLASGLHTKSFAYIVNLNNTSNKQYVYRPHLYSDNTSIHALCNNFYSRYWLPFIGIGVMFFFMFTTLFMLYGKMNK